MKNILLKISIVTASFIFLCPVVRGEEITLMSYYPSPIGVYIEARIGVKDTTTTPATNHFLTIGYDAPNACHLISASGSDDIKFSHDGSADDLVINSGDGYVGIGSNNPSCNLHIKDVTEGINDFVGIRLDSQKGNDEGIYFHFTESGPSPGPGVDIGWLLSRYNDITSRYEMIVGNDPGYNTQLNISSNLIYIGTPGCNIYFPDGTDPAALDSFGLYFDGTQWHLPSHQHLSIPSSRELKKDIAPFSKDEYKEMLSRLDDLEIVRFRYKKDPEHSKLRIGVIAEDSPDEITTEDKKALDNVSTIGFILAILKTQNEEIQTLKQEIEELKKHKNK